MSGDEDLVRRSDQVDRQIIAVKARHHYALVAILVFLVALALAQSVFLIRLSRDNHRVLVAQIPGLQEQITRRNEEIGDQRYELAQAVAAIQKLAAQVVRLGGDPGQIVIKPPKHPQANQ